MSQKTPPPPKCSVYQNAVIDIRKKPGADDYVVEVKKTRRAARDFVTWHKDADHLRIRRCRISIYDS